MTAKAATALLAGAGQTDITPVPGIQLAGDIGRHRPTEEVRERLHARALVFDAGGERVCLVVLDLLATSNEWANEIRQRAAQRFGLRPEAIMLNVTQNHAAPQIGHTFVRDECGLMPEAHPWLRGGDERYNEPAVASILDAIGQALGALRPVALSAGRGMDGRVAFNRRFVMRDGTARCHPAVCDPNILHAEGPVDPEVGVLRVAPADGAADAPAIALLLHHTCHPTAGYPMRYVIGDWPGVWAELMQPQGGAGCVPLVVNGCCGNIHHNNHLDPAYKCDHRRNGELLAETATRVLGKLEPLPGARVGTKRTVLRLPLRALPPAEVAAARKLIIEHPEPMWLDAEHTRVHWDWVYAVAMLDLADARQERATADYEVQVFRLGDAALVGLQGEPFVEAQLRIKLESPARYTFVAHFCNGDVGYVPTRRALERGGYETRTANWSKFAPEALERIEDTALGLLRELF